MWVPPKEYTQGVGLWARFLCNECELNRLYGLTPVATNKHDPNIRVEKTSERRWEKDGARLVTPVRGMQGARDRAISNKTKDFCYE